MSLGNSHGAELVARADPIVVETDVHHPIVVNLLWDAMRVMVRATARGWQRSMT